MNNPSRAVQFSIEGISKEYGGRKVLEIPQLDVFQGEILAIVGPSGSGKSTLLRLLNFLEPPTMGKIKYHANEFGPGIEMPLESRRKVTMVFQQPLLLNLSVYANVKYGLDLRGKKEDRNLITSVLDQVGLGALKNQKARTLSGGEAQRVALARAMVIQPEVLLLDEPTANLDPFNVNIIENIIRQLNQERHTTLIIVTHNVFQAHRLADRVVFLLDGRIVEDSDAHTFFNNPSDPRTLAFMRGDMVY